MAGKLDAARIQKKYQQSMSTAGQNYKDGTSSTDKNPMQLAIAHKDALIQRFTEAVNNGTWEAMLSKVTVQQWKQACSDFGATNLQNSAPKGAAKIGRYFQAAAPRIRQIQDEVRAMPNATDQQREARMIANKNLMKSLKGLGKGG